MGSNWFGSGNTGAYQSDYRYHAAGTGGNNKATWTFAGWDTSKHYQVLATWVASSSRASDAPFTVLDNTAVCTTRLNQQYTPTDVTLDSRTWQSVGVYCVSSGKLIVQISDDANGSVIADAIRLVEVPAVVVAPSVIDDGEAAYAETGSNWLALQSAYQSDYRYHAAGTGENKATWTFAGLDTSKHYQVSRYMGCQQQPSQQRAFHRPRQHNRSRHNSPESTIHADRSDAG